MCVELDMQMFVDRAFGLKDRIVVNSQTATDANDKRLLLLSGEMLRAEVQRFIAVVLQRLLVRAVIAAGNEHVREAEHRGSIHNGTGDHTLGTTTLGLSLMRGHKGERRIVGP